MVPMRSGPKGRRQTFHALKVKSKYTEYHCLKRELRFLILCWSVGPLLQNRDKFVIRHVFFIFYLQES